MTAVALGGLGLYVPSAEGVQRAVLSGATASQAGSDRQRRLLLGRVRCRTLKAMATKTCADSIAARVATARTSTGAVSKATALLAFASEIAPLPGVKVSGTPGVTEDGTGAIDDLLAYLPQLSHSQRAAALAALARIERGPVGIRVLSAGGIDPAPVKALALRFAQSYEKALGIQYRGTLEIRFCCAVTWPNIFAFADSLDANGGRDPSLPARRCVIFVTPLTLALYPEKSPSFGQVLAHEVFHCFQAQMVSSLNRVWTFDKNSKWLVEGGADWAACTVQPTGDVIPAHLAGYLYKPGVELVKREYDAAGFFSHLEARDIDPFAAMKTVFFGGPGPTNAALFQELLKNDPEKERSVLDSWAPGFIQNASRGPDWDAKPGCAGNYQAAPPEPLKIKNDQTVQVAVGQLATAQFTLDSSADMVQVQMGEHGYGRINGRSETNALIDDHLRDLAPSAKTYCLRRGGCSCPGPPNQITQLKDTPFPVLALTGDTEGGSVTLKGIPLRCGVITKATFVVGNAKYIGTVSGTTWNTSLNWSITWDETAEPHTLPLNPGNYEYANKQQTKGTGSWTISPTTPACGTGGTLTLNGPDSPGDARISVIDSKGSGESQTWTIRLQANESQTGYSIVSSTCPGPPWDYEGLTFNDHLFETTVTLKATGRNTPHTETFNVAADPTHANGNPAETWTGTVTITGIF